MLKNLKSLFFVSDENTQNTQPPVAEDQMVSPTVVPKVPPRVSVLPPTAAPNTQFTDLLLKALADNNLDGLDYFEFKQSIKATDTLTIDENTRFRTAFAMAQTMGLTYDKLVESAAYYLKVLEREEVRFADAMRQQGDGKNRTMIDEVAAMEKAVIDKNALIVQLQAEIQDLQTQIMTRKEAVASHAQKLEATKNGFEASYQAVRGQIEIDMQKIQQYLK